MRSAAPPGQSTLTSRTSDSKTVRRAGLPRNLAMLHNPLLKPVAVRYWARAMRSPMGELCFAAHCRHAEAEMRALGDDVVARLNDSPRTSHLRQLLQAA